MKDRWVKALLRFPANIGRAREFLSHRKDKSEGALKCVPIALDLRTPQLLLDCGRHLACIAQHARIAGSPTYVRCRRLLLSEIGRKHFGEMFLTDPHVTWLPPNRRLPADAFVLYDSARPPSDLLPTQSSVRMMIGRDIVTNSAVMPYPMHPATLRRIDRLTLQELRESMRRFDLFFAGAQIPRYGSARMQQNFGIQSRLALLNAVHEFRGDRVIRTIADNIEPKAIVLLDSATCPIPSGYWLATLAQADFFLCCPGGAQPMCHNVIEAMSVGTIPLVEYSDRFTPALTDGQNAICFRGKDGLRRALERIDRMTPPQRAEMRRRVSEYYERYLRGDQFLARLRDGNIDIGSRMVSMPFDAVNLFRRDVSRQPQQVA